MAPVAQVAPVAPIAPPVIYPRGLFVYISHECAIKIGSASVYDESIICPLALVPNNVLLGRPAIVTLQLKNASPLPSKIIPTVPLFVPSLVINIL